MRHDWIFDVLADLHDYADRNGLAGLKAKVQETLVVARSEVAAAAEEDGDSVAPAPRSVRRAH